MLPKAYLTSHSRMSGSRWVITPLWLSESWRSFLNSSSVYSYHFFISSASVRSIPFLSFILPIFAWKCFLGISSFLQEISSLSHSVVFLYLFALVAEEGFLLSPCSSLELCIQMVCLSFSLHLSFPSFLSCGKASAEAILSSPRPSPRQRNENRVPPGAQQFQDSSPILSMVPPGLHSQ